MAPRIWSKTPCCDGLIEELPIALCPLVLLPLPLLLLLLQLVLLVRRQRQRQRQQQQQQEQKDLLVIYTSPCYCCSDA